MHRPNRRSDRYGGRNPRRSANPVSRFLNWWGIGLASCMPRVISNLLFVEDASLSPRPRHEIQNFKQSFKPTSNASVYTATSGLDPNHRPRQATGQTLLPVKTIKKVLRSEHVSNGHIQAVPSAPSHDVFVEPEAYLDIESSEEVCEVILPRARSKPATHSIVFDAVPIDRRRFAPSLGAFLSAALLTVSIMLIAGLFVHQSLEIRRTETAIQDLKGISELVLASNEKNDHLISKLTQLENEINAPTKFQLVYQELTRIIPDHTWIQTLRYSEHGIALSGFSRQPDELLTVIRSMAFIQDANFTQTSPVSISQDYSAFTLQIVFHEGRD